MTANTESKTTTTKTTTTVKPTPEETKKETVNPFRLKDTFNNFLWTVVGLPDCPWTEKAIKTLQEHDEKFKIVYLNEEWRRRLVVQYNTRQVPAIFKNNLYIGNYSALESYYSGSFIDDSERFK